MSLSKGEWADVKVKLSSAYGGEVSLKCDDYLLSPRVVQRNMRLVIMVYVDGYFRGRDVWYGKESKLAEMSNIARRFYCLHSKGQPAKQAALLMKIYGKKGCQERGYLEKSCYAYPEFRTPGAFIAHIKKHNPSIELLDYETFAKLRAAQPEEVINATE